MRALRLYLIALAAVAWLTLGSIERAGGGALALDADERAFEAIMRRAKVFAKVPGLKKEIAGNPEAVAGIMLSLQGYGLAVTIPGINMAFDWIEGRAEPSALFYQAVARHNGYHIDPRIRTAELAVAHITCPSDPYDEPSQVEFTMDDAVRAHRLDEWVEVWRTYMGDDNRQHKAKIIVTTAVNGEPVAELVDKNGAPVPEAAAIRDRGEVKRFDAWWNYRADMLWKSAAKRAVKVACPHVLLGGSDFEHPVSSRSSVRGSAGAAGQDFIDVDAVDEPTPAPGDSPKYPPGEEPF